MKKSIAILTFTGFLIMTASSAFAQQATKIAYLDLSRLFDSYEKTKEFDAELTAKQQVYEKERNTRIEKLREEQNKLSLLNDAEKEKAQQEVERMRDDLVEYDQAQRTELTKQRDEKVREILLEIEKIVSDFAKKEGYDIILNDRVLIYGNEAMDVTEPVLKILNDQYAKSSSGASAGN